MKKLCILLIFLLIFALSCGSSGDDYEDTELRLVSVSGSTVTIAWTNVPQAAHYNIYRDGALIGTAVSRVYVDNSLSAGTYRYQVSAVRQGDLHEGSRSNTITAVVN